MDPICLIPEKISPSNSAEIRNVRKRRYFFKRILKNKGDFLERGRDPLVKVPIYTGKSQKKNVTILSIFWRCFRTPLPIPLQNLHFQHFEDRFRAFGRIKSIRTGQKGPVNTISSRQTFRKQHKSFFRAEIVQNPPQIFYFVGVCPPPFSPDFDSKGGGFLS